MGMQEELKLGNFMERAAGAHRAQAQNGPHWVSSSKEGLSALPDLPGMFFPPKSTCPTGFFSVTTFPDLCRQAASSAFPAFVLPVALVTMWSFHSFLFVSPVK